MLAQLINVLSPRALGRDRFRGSNVHPEAHRVYGGQVLAQALSVAVSTVADDRIMHSQHAYFLRPGMPGEAIDFEVERARDGLSFSSRRVVAYQRDKPIFVSSLSFQQAASGDDYQPEPPDAPAPEELVSERQLGLEAGNIDENYMITTGEELDIRLVDPVDWQNLQPRPPMLQAWMKTSGPLPNDTGLHQAVLAYLSDAYLIDVCLITHGRSYLASNIQVASLDHALWVHEPFRADEWLLHTVHVERIGGGRGLARGSFYTRDGRLVATSMQQALMRFR